MRAVFDKKKLAVLALGIIAIIVFFAGRPDGLLHIYTLNVGQGDAILIQTPENQHILVDGGPDNTVIRELGAVLPFWQRKIDLIILSHPDRDHLTGLLEVVKRYSVGRALVTGVPKKDAMYDEFIMLLQTHGVPTTFADSDSDLIFGGVNLDMLFPLNPLLTSAATELNETSIIFKMEYKEATALFMGDSGVATEKFLISEYGSETLKADVLKIGHHGSRTSTDQEFLAAVDPDYALISCGKDNRFGHPHPEVLRALSAQKTTMLRTDISGRLEMWSDGVEWMTE